MGIEPLGSVMTFQAQTAVQQPKPIPKQDAGNMEVTAPEQISMMNLATGKIAYVEKKDGQSSDNAGEQQENNEQIKKAIEKMNKNMSHSEAIFGIHEETNRVVIKIVNKETKEVIKEFPPEKTLNMIAKAWELAGLMVDEKR